VGSSNSRMRGPFAEGAGNRNPHAAAAGELAGYLLACSAIRPRSSRAVLGRSTSAAAFVAHSTALGRVLQHGENGEQG